MLLTTLNPLLLALAVPVMAFATAGIWATMVAIPKSLHGVYRMHIYAPPAAYFIGCALFMCMIAPIAEFTNADQVPHLVSLAIAAIFAVVGFVSLKRGGHAVLFR